MDTGFDSLESTLLVNRLTKELGIKVPADLLNDAPTVGEMVDLLKDKEEVVTNRGLSRLSTGDSSTGAAHVYVIHGIDGDVFGEG